VSRALRASTQRRVTSLVRSTFKFAAHTFKDILIYYKESANSTNGLGSRGSSFVERLSLMPDILKNVARYRADNQITCRTAGYRGKIYEFVQSSYKAFLSQNEWTATQALYKFLARTGLMERFAAWNNKYCTYNKGNFDQRSAVFAASTLISLVYGTVRSSLMSCFQAAAGG
jgi:hypothetical protein